MKVKQYTDKKNKIVYKHTRLVLIPKDQVIEMPVTQEMVENIKSYLEVLKDAGSEPIKSNTLLGTYNCLYCSEFFFLDDDCADCPMSKAGNFCLSGTGSYTDCCNVLDNAPREKHLALQGELHTLAQEFFKAHKKLLEEVAK